MKKIINIRIIDFFTENGLIKKNPDFNKPMNNLVKRKKNGFKFLKYWNQDLWNNAEGTI